jgi:NAD(P)-dependent dehydrogenase (short-subunit alcohol dehydrogenase family)
MGRLEDKVAIITGATGGIGAATAKRFVEEGAKVLIVDLDEERCQAVADELGDAAEPFAADVTDEEQVKAYVDACVDAFGGVDILFDNAGIEGAVAPLLEQTREDFQKVLDVNLVGAWMGIKHAAPKIAERGGGSIVVTSSVAGLIGSAGLGPYISSKHAVLGLVKTSAQELASMNIRVNAVNPGPIDNRMMDSIQDQANPGHGDEVRSAFEQMTPMKRYGTNEEIANLALFLASDESSYCTGAAYLADGGFVSM